VCHYDALRGNAKQRLEITLGCIGIDKDGISFTDRPRDLAIVVAPRIRRQVIGIVQEVEVVDRNDPPARPPGRGDEIRGVQKIEL